MTTQSTGSAHGGVNDPERMDRRFFDEGIITVEAEKSPIRDISYQGSQIHREWMSEDEAVELTKLQLRTTYWS